MKFAKVFQQTLIEEEIPDEWAEAAIQYKVLKKCIGRVVKELEFLGLSKSDVKLLLQDESGNESVELLDEETVPNNPVIAKYSLAKSRKSNEVIPFLKISVNNTSIDSNQSQKTLELADVIRSKLQRVLDATDEEHQFVEIREDDDGLTLSPQTSHDENHIVSVRNNEIVVLLNSDLKFFGMLNTEIENLDQIRKTEEANIIQEISNVSESVSRLTEKKADLYLWRELFKIYLDSEIFFRYNETSSQQLERNSDMIKQNLEVFSANVAKTKLLEKMARKRSVNTFDRFVAINERLFKILMFQSINTTALRKILKKFDKQTAFNVSSEFPALISQDHVFIHGSSLAQSICYTIQTTLLVIDITMATELDRSERYDRQLRLWAKDGQSRLERSHVCLINATPTGAEALKNLILPGIGAFTVVDERVVSEEDLSGNFFLTEDDIGLEIAYQMSRSLSELNPDVVYRAVPESIEECLLNPAFFDEFDIVLVSDYIPLSDMLVLKQRLWNKNVPLLHVNSCGLYGTLQVFCEETTIVETHDPSQLYDLRIDQPWPELQQYVDSFNLDTLDDTDHAHVPYIVIFIKGLQNWKKDHDGCSPKNYAEKRIFKAEYIESLSRNINLEANFLEASSQIHRALQATVVPNYLKELFGDKRISDENLSEETPLFWMFVKALSYFVENEGALPLPGSLPDMVSSTCNYITLQQLYRNKALKDQMKFADLLKSLLSRVGKAEDVSIDSGLERFILQRTQK
ncbi:uncharacterized protein CXQ87_004786 [Candidozyma duobushaemuli]|uniref:NEDD8-activating enzyme E1 regulatory subunit n=1 Tax=Candidozyma duobushaemuli TaxID=1231522 RepID=A0A2V1AGZ5_9ASCO|nr:uncharacterized protein CXQ87_004786 [[Candida] duobushaemulonis]PVH16493.1 hypothetical protein CXQ87_004786 [[Candida] duobushaemulonis]